MCDPMSVLIHSILLCPGDLIAASVGVSAKPEIWEHTVGEDDKFVIIASDGVWEFISNQGQLRGEARRGDAMGLINVLCVAGGMCDVCP